MCANEQRSDQHNHQRNEPRNEQRSDQHNTQRQSRMTMARIT